jgi:hypothetical protein
MSSYPRLIGSGMDGWDGSKFQRMLLLTFQVPPIYVVHSTVSKHEQVGTYKKNVPEMHSQRATSPLVIRLSATVTPKFSPIYHFFPPIFPSIFSFPAAVPPKYSPISHYNYKISFSISTINFLSTNNYSWTHSTVFRVMNSDTLDLGGERRGPTRRGRCRGHRCGRKVSPTATMQGEGDGEGAALRTALVHPHSYTLRTSAADGSAGGHNG